MNKEEELAQERIRFERDSQEKQQTFFLEALSY